ncbi:uncharacterized protein KY384_003595 [Bacidia gigantensis]|uniref:uncharacterized protein n=1 Tax=Bacidia gigantensis TaxID=2732470 RepID=UPI001D0577D1|nr:uncharacterized protein KY384_003595 [Bacidia gigantensis]KAG8531959.1 hypothetical protein KY384_003595 [Bacidia gigantensis]
MSTQDLPIRRLLKQETNTAALNIVSWNKAYSIYPSQTFKDGEAYFFGVQSVHPELSVWAGVYEKRGLNFCHRKVLMEHATNDAMKSSRRVADRQSWIISLSTAEIKTSSTPDYGLEYAHFTVHRSYEGEGLAMLGSKEFLFSEYYVDSCTKRASSLKYRHTCGHSWGKFLQRIMSYSSIDEINKLSSDVRPSNLTELMQRPEEMHEHLDTKQFSTWTYYDDEIPALFHEWQENPIEILR